MAEYNDYWITRAMADETLVANLLLNLHKPSFNFRWSVHQRRSKLHAATSNKDERNRESPTTPLSCGVGTSGGNYSESSTRQTEPVGKQSEAATPNNKRKRKTLPKALEVEKILLEEKKNLKNKLAIMRLAVKEHRARNERLKRIKLHLESQSTSETATTTLVSGEASLHPPQVFEAPCEPSESVSPQAVQDKVLDNASSVCDANASSAQQQETGSQEHKFLLPDLNLQPEEEEEYGNSNVIPPESSS